MISLDEATSLAADRPRPEAGEPPALTPEEEIRLDYIESTIDAGVYGGFTGDPFEFTLPAEYEGAVFGTPAIVENLRRRAGEAGWSALVQPVGADGANLDLRSADSAAWWRFLFAPRAVAAAGASSSRETVPPLPEVVPIPVGGPDCRLLIRMPTRQRPQQALRVLELYRRMAGAPVAIEVVLDEDDETMVNPAVLQRLRALDCRVVIGRHISKVDACNHGDGVDWDVLALASDDMVPIREGYAWRILDAMREHWPHLDGAIYFGDGHHPGGLCTLPILGRRLYEQFGRCVYERAYKSLHCDVEQTLLLGEMGRLVHVDEVIIEHRHHLWGRAERDALYQRNDALDGEDRATFERRRSTRLARSQFHFGAPPLWLSICIATVPERELQLRRLLDDLWGQILGLGAGLDPRCVEVIVDDRVDLTIGEKRQAMIGRARGHFVAHVDDDDGVHHRYVERVVRAISVDPDADCASLIGLMTQRGGTSAVRFEHSIKHAEWKMEGGAHVRTPNHLNAVARKLALQTSFADKETGEDWDFATRLRPLLKHEVSTGDEPLYYYWKV